MKQAVVVIGFLMAMLCMWIGYEAFMTLGRAG